MTLHAKNVQEGAEKFLSYLCVKKKQKKKKTSEY